MRVTQLGLLGIKSQPEASSSTLVADYMFEAPLWKLRRLRSAAALFRRRSGLGMRRARGGAVQSS